MGTEKVKIKKINRNRIFRYIMEKECASSAEISRDLLISLPTISQHISVLRQSNLITDGKLYESTGGRRAKTFACNARAKVGVGISITSNCVEFAIVDLLGDVAAYQSVDTLCDFSAGFLEMLQKNIFDLLRQNQIEKDTVLGVGISLPAIIDGDGRICETAFAWPIPTDFQMELQKRLPYCVECFNDATSGGYAEFWHCKQGENLFYLSLNSSVGGAVRIHNKMVDGDDYRGAEIGHTTIVPDGRPCYCGRRGCVNAYCSSLNLHTANGGGLSEFFKALAEQDPDCLERWDQYLEYLAITVNNIRQLYDCGVILGGSVSSHLAPYLPDLMERLQNRDSFHRDGSYVRISKYDSESTAVGAALRFIDHFIENV